MQQLSRAHDDFWLAKPVPRYTSYPPAPCFNETTTHETYAQILRAIPEDEAISLYLHVPFCRHLCLYCGCHTSVTQRPERVVAYIETLKNELRLLTDVAGQRLKVSHLHFGGGTPNIMSPETYHSLFQFMKTHYDFSACTESAMELDPRLVTEEQVAAMAACGVTRVSLGVQDFDLKVQTAINRVQPFEQVAEVCAMLRRAGITAINFDLMYGLPLQTPKTIETTARQALSLEPSRIAFFSYAHVPQIKGHQKALEVYGLPDKYTLLDQEQVGRQLCLDAGYVPIGMDHFARHDDSLCRATLAGKLRRNFQGYTDDTATRLLGVGASSIGQTPEGFFQNERTVPTYETLIGTHQLATLRGLLVNDDDRLRAAVIERLMCAMEVDLSALCLQHKTDLSVFNAEMEALKPFVEAGIVSFDSTTLRLTSPRRMAIRVVAHLFDRYSAALKAVASKAA